MTWRAMVLGGACLAAAFGAHAQQDEGVAQKSVAKSGMDQGQAAIAVRSDVKLAIKGTGGTPSAKVQALSEALSARMNRVSACYDKRIAERPATVGAFRVDVRYERGKVAPSLAMQEAGGSDSDLKRCIGRVLKKTRLPPHARPAEAIVKLTFDNTRAQGQRQMDDHVAERPGVDVHTTADGGHEARWQTPRELVTFVVRAESDQPDATVGAVATALRKGFAVFVDCRRRANRHGMSPEGDSVFNVRVRAGGRLRAKLLSTTVEDKRNARCMPKAFQRIDLAGDPPPGQVQVTIHFAP